MNGQKLTVFKQSIGIVCYNTSGMLKKCVDHILSTQGLNLNETLFILTNPGSSDNTELVCNSYSNINKIVISMDYKSAVENHYASARSINDQMAISILLGIPYFIMHDNDAFMNNNRMNPMINSMYDKYDRELIVMGGRPSYAVEFPQDKREYFFEGYKYPCQLFTMATIDVKKFVDNIGWWSESLMPHNDIDNDINSRIFNNSRFKNDEIGIMVDYLNIYEHYGRVSEKAPNYNPVLRQDGIRHWDVYKMMWGQYAPGYINVHPLNNIKFDRGVNYDFIPMNNSAVFKRVDKIINEFIKNQN